MRSKQKTGTRPACRVELAGVRALHMPGSDTGWAGASVGGSVTSPNASPPHMRALSGLPGPCHKHDLAASSRIEPVRRRPKNGSPP